MLVMTNVPLNAASGGVNATVTCWPIKKPCGAAIVSVTTLLVNDLFVALAATVTALTNVVEASEPSA